MMQLYTSEKHIYSKTHKSQKVKIIQEMTLKVKCWDTKTDIKPINIYSYCSMYKEYG